MPTAGQIYVLTYEDVFRLLSGDYFLQDLHFIILGLQNLKVISTEKIYVSLYQVDGYAPLAFSVLFIGVRYYTYTFWAND